MGESDEDLEKGYESFVEEIPEDEFSYEEMLYPVRSKCRKRGAKKRDKFVSR